MATIHLGTDSEFVKIDWPSSFTSEGWSQANVEIAVPGFTGRICPWVERAAIQEFFEQLRSMYGSLQGEAEFTPMERQFTMKLACGKLGEVRISGEAWSQATYGNRLEFDLGIDQSYLLQALQELETLLSAAGDGDASEETQRELSD